MEPKEAKKTSCKCYEVNGELLCTSEGIVGKLTDSQEEKFCTEKVVKGATPELQKVYGRFKDMGAIQDVCLESSVSEDEYPTCIKDGGRLLEQGASSEEVEEKLAKKYGVEVD